MTSSPAQDILVACGSIAALIFTLTAAWIAKSFAKWTGIQLSQQQMDILHAATETIANALKVMIAKGSMSLANTHEQDKTVLNVTLAHLTPAIREAMQAHGMDEQDVARKAVAQIGKDQAFMISQALPPSLPQSTDPTLVKELRP
jgi:hypothetical protein